MNRAPDVASPSSLTRDCDMSKNVASAMMTFAAVGLALVLGTFFFAGGRQPETAKAGNAVTTEQAAANAGAKLLPSEPRLRVEPR
jgi:hypothetical protein